MYSLWTIIPVPPAEKYKNTCYGKWDKNWLRSKKLINELFPKLKRTESLAFLEKAHIKMWITCG